MPKSDGSRLAKLLKPMTKEERVRFLLRYLTAFTRKKKRRKYLNPPTYPLCERCNVLVIRSRNGYHYCPREPLGLALSALQLNSKFWKEFGAERHQAAEGPFAMDVEIVLGVILGRTEK